MVGGEGVKGRMRVRGEMRRGSAASGECGENKMEVVDFFYLWNFGEFETQTL